MRETGIVDEDVQLSRVDLVADTLNVVGVPEVGLDCLHRHPVRGFQTRSEFPETVLTSGDDD